MTCGCEGQPLKLSLDIARGTGVHWARLLWVVAVRIFGEPARLSIGNQQDQSQAAPHSPITRDLRENQCLLKQRHRRQTDSSLLPADRVTPAGAAPTRTCGARAADMEALRLPVLSVLRRQRVPLRFCTGRGRRLVFSLFTSITKKQCQISFLLTHHFRFFLFIFGSSRSGAGG